MRDQWLKTDHLQAKNEYEVNLVRMRQRQIEMLEQLVSVDRKREP
jgi:hypothetical protein